MIPRAWPSITGIHDFKGTKLHTAAWDPAISVEELSDKNVAIIGAGSSGIQVLPTLQPHCKHIDHYMKGKNWISPFGLGGSVLAERGVTTGNCKGLTATRDIFTSSR